MFTIIDFGMIPRELDFPYRVAQAGNTHFFRQPVNSFLFRDYEFSLRLESASGIATDEVDGVRYRTAFPHLLIKRPGMRLRTRFDDMRDTLFFCYSADTGEKLRQAGLVSDLPFQQFELTGELAAQLKQLQYYLNRSLEFSIADRIDLLCFSILEELAFLRKLDSRKNDGAADRMRKVASFLQMNLHRTLSVAEIAAYFRISERTLFREWRECYGSSPAQYIARQRLLQARLLLENSVLSVDAIAARTGFCSGNYFITRFKKAFGLTPNAYRLSAGKLVR